MKSNKLLLNKVIALYISTFMQNCAHCCWVKAKLHDSDNAAAFDYASIHYSFSISPIMHRS